MKRSELPTADVLQRMIEKRYDTTLGAASGEPASSTIQFGTRPHSPWRWPALFEVNARRADGASIASALESVYRDHAVSQIANCTLASFKRGYEVFRGEELRQHFYASILNGDVSEAMTALTWCNDDVRSQIWLDLTRDSPPTLEG